MRQNLLEVKRERFDLTDQRKYLLQGIWPRDAKVEAVFGGQRLETQKEAWKNDSALDRFKDQDQEEGERISLTVYLPRDLTGGRQLEIFALTGAERKRWFRIGAEELEAKRRLPHFFLEQVQRDLADHTCSVTGWAAAAQPVEIRVTDPQGKALPARIQRQTRVDVQALYGECQPEEKCGFTVEVKDCPRQGLRLVFQAGDQTNSQSISMEKSQIRREQALEYLKKTRQYVKNHGILALPRKVVEKLRRQDQPISYEEWRRRHLPTAQELDQQRQTAFPQGPVFSIVVPLYKTKEKYLRLLVDSIRAQTYGKWELCLSDGSGSPSPLRELLAELQACEPRIKVIFHDQPLRISENTNAAIEAAAGDFLVFADHDDTLAPNALYECAKALQDKPDTRILYSDEDKVDGERDKYFEPHMKPDYNPDLLCSVNYICHLFVVERRLAQEAGLLRSEYDGAQDYDFVLRCVEASDRICHIPKVLYHWRSHQESTAENPESKAYAFEAGRRAVQAHYDRLGIRALVSQGEYPGLYRTRFLRDHDPLISILIPNKDHVEDLERCISSIETRSTYRNYEFIIIENNSEKEETFAYYRKLEAKKDKVRVVYWKEGFNYSAINNFGAQYARGDYLLLLNNDTEIINPDCLEELLGYGMRPDVGAVGARLYYEDDTIQHAGVVVGFGGIAGHCFVQQPRGSTGYCHRIICAQDYSAVTAACMLVDRKAFQEVGGLSPELAVAFNDIDFCLKLRQAGYLIVYNPYAELYHYESKSRGLDNTPDKVARFNQEIATFAKRWPEILQKGDPYYSPNLTLDSQDFSLRKE